MIETCGYLLGCLLVGYAVVALIYRKQSISWSFAVGLSFQLGCCEVALLFFYLALTGIRPGRGSLFIVDGAAIVVIGALFVAGRCVVPHWPKDCKQLHFRWHDLFYAIPAALAGYAGVTALRIATKTPLLGWDVWSFWLYKAKFLAAEKLIPAPWVFLSPSGSYTHAHYPLLWPILAAGAYGITGTTDDHYARLVLVFLFVGWGLLTYSALRWKLARLPAAMIASMQLSLPMVTQYASNGQADVLMLEFYAGMIYLILRFGESADWAFSISAALLATGAAFTKNEGLPLAGFGAVLMLVLAVRHKSARAALMAGTFAGIIVVSLIPWYLWSRHFPRTDEDYGSHVSAVFVGANLQRLGAIFSAMGGELVNWNGWGPLWALLAIIAVIGWRGFQQSYILVLWAVLAAHFLLYVFIYVISPADVNWLFYTTLDRLVMHITPLAILLIGYHWSAFVAGDAPRERGR